MMITQPVLSRILAFAAIAFLVGARSFGQAPVDGAPIPPISQAGSCEYDRLLQFVNIPLKALPEGVRLVQRVRTAPLVPFTHNPAVLVDLEKIKRLAVFFGIDEKTDLQSVRAAVAAIYQEGHPSREIGVYGLWFSDKNAANDWSKRLKADCEGSPFFRKDGLLLYLWKDDGVSDQAFAAMRNYLKVAGCHGRLARPCCFPRGERGKRIATPRSLPTIGPASAGTCSRAGSTRQGRASRPWHRPLTSGTAGAEASSKSRGRQTERCQLSHPR